MIIKKLFDMWRSTKNKSPKLIGVEIDGLRGVNSLYLEFKYPVVAIAGENGTGKTTILGSIACAYKGIESFKPINKRGLSDDYTFGHFIVKSILDNPFHSNPQVKWYYSGEGYPEHFTMKRKNRRWSPLNKARPARAVQFISLSRINPAIEKHVQYSDFIGNKKVEPKDFEEKLITLTSRVLGKKYIKAQTHSSLSNHVLTLDKGNGNYSSFNMGSGEEVVFNILHTLIEIPKGALVIIDEVETGLHPRAQKELINVMMEFAVERHLQIVMSTHSKVILDALPPEGRILLTREADRIIPEYKISGEYAYSRLMDEQSAELKIYVEDTIGKYILEYVLPLELRRRVNIKIIGSWTFVVKQLAAFYRDKIGNCLAVLDGDCVYKNPEALFYGEIENSIRHSKEEYSEWFNNRHLLLPSDKPPEKWLIDLPKSDEFLLSFAQVTSSSLGDIKELFMKPEPSDVHNYFFELSKSLSLDKDDTAKLYIRLIVDKEHIEIKKIVEKVKLLLQ